MNGLIGTDPYRIRPARDATERRCRLNDPSRTLPPGESVNRAAPAEVPSDDLDVGYGFSSPPSADDTSSRFKAQLGLRHHLNADYESAIALFSNVLQHDPSNARVFGLRSEAHRALGNLDRALADCSAAIGLDATNAIHLVDRGKVHRLKGDFEAAAADCTAALERDPKCAEAFAVRAGARADGGSPDAALADYSAAIALTPRDLFAHFHRGKVHADRGDYDRAIEDFGKVLEINPHYIPALVQRGHARRDRGDFRQAVSDYTEALSHVRNPTVYNGRGLAYERLGDGERAVADYSEAIRLDPSDAAAYGRRGALLRSTGDHERALADLDQAVRRDPRNAAAFYNRGMIGLAVDQLPQAIAQFDEAVRLAPDYAVAFLNRAIAHDRSGDFPAAVRDCARALRLEPDSAPAYLIRGTAFLDAQEFDRAIDDFDRVLRFDPGNALAYRRRARAHTYLKSFDAALADYSALIEREPDNAPAHAHRAIVYRLKGDREGALADLDRALQIDPRSVLVGWDRGLSELDRRLNAHALTEFAEGRSPPRANAGRPVPTDGATALAVAAIAPALRVPVAATESAAPLATRPVYALPDDFGVEAMGRVDTTAGAAPSGRVGPVLAEAEASAVLLEEVPPASAIPVASAAKEDAKAEAVPRGARVRCPMCRTVAPATVSASGQRARCANCNVVFISKPIPGAVNASSAAGKSTDAKAIVAALADSAAPKSRERWAARAWLGGAVITAVALLALATGSTSPGRVAVHPARGMLRYDGKPLANATVVLVSTSSAQSSVPQPRGTTKADGSFVVGTYGEEDGAPAGEYKVTVHWKWDADGEGNADRVPTSPQQARFGNTKSLDKSVLVGSGTNDIPALDAKLDEARPSPRGAGTAATKGRSKSR